MDTQEPDVPVYRISKLEDRQRLLAEALAHAESQEAQYKVIPADDPVTGRWKSPLALAVLAVAAVVSVAPPAWLTGPDAPRPTPEELDRGLRAAVYLQAQQVEAFRVREGHLPDDLSELPAALPGLAYLRSNNRVFQIRARQGDGSLVIYDSALPSPAFAAAAGWLDQGAP